MNLWLSLNKALTLYPHKEALVDGEKRFTYEQFGRRVANLVTALRALGCKPGTVVAIAAPNGHEYMEVYYACGVAGFVLSPLNYRLAPLELGAILQDADTEVLIAHTDFAEAVSEYATKCSTLKHIIWIGDGGTEIQSLSCRGYEECTKGDGTFNDLPYPSASDLVHLYFTSGTTGRPKGVMLTQGNVAFNALAVVADLALRDSDTWLHAAPMFHLADAWSIFSITWVGGKHVFVPHFNAAHALAAIAREKVTLSVLVPTMLNAILNEPSLQDHDVTSLRLVLTGGSPIAPEMVRKATAQLQCEYVQLYGMTETSPFLTLSLPKSHLSLSKEQELDLRSRTGRPYIGAEVKVVRPDGTEVTHDNREVGEIIARGPTIFQGYWRQPEATADTLKDGWIYTGDLAVVDAEGYINIVDRKKDMIITGGENVYSTEIEYVLHEHPAVLECAILGIPDDYWGESIKAVVSLRNGMKTTEQELMQFVRDRLAHYKVPRSIEFIDHLPKTGSGKIYKKGLRELYWKQREKQVN